MKCAAMLLLLTVSLAGCGIRYVYVPVPTCPPPPVMVMPMLAVDQLPQKPETAAGLKALAADHVTLKSTLEQCIVTLDGYRTPPKTKE